MGNVRAGAIIDNGEWDTDLSSANNCKKEQPEDVLGITVHGNSSMAVKGMIQGTPLTWKVDSGARRTFITEDTFLEITPEERPVLEPSRTRFEAADGNEITVLVGTAVMLLTFDDASIEFRVFVGKIKTNLLGRDFITNFKCHWDYDNWTFLINNTPCTEGKDSPSETFVSSRVVSVETVTIPPMHEAIMKSKLTRKTSPVDGVSVPEQHFLYSHKLALARVLVDARQDRICQIV